MPSGACAFAARRSGQGARFWVAIAASPIGHRACPFLLWCGFADHQTRLYIKVQALAQMAAVAPAEPAEPAEVADAFQRTLFLTIC